MKPHFHLAANIAIAVPLYYTGFLANIQYLILFILSSLLIDLDHLFIFAFKHKTINPRKWWELGVTYYQKKQTNFYIFHAPESNLFLALLSLYYHLFLVILISNLVHLALDIINHYQKQKVLQSLEEWSIINALLKLNKKA